MTTERFDQICNNVTEEFVDLNQTDFATKKELCEVIYELLDKISVDHNRRQSELLDKLRCTVHSKPPLVVP